MPPLGLGCLRLGHDVVSVVVGVVFDGVDLDFDCGALTFIGWGRDGLGMAHGTNSTLDTFASLPTF